MADHTRLCPGVVRRLWAEEGATMFEYGLLLASIALVVLVVAALLGQNVLPLYEVKIP